MPFYFCLTFSKCRITCTVNKVSFINSPLTVAMKSGQFWGFKSITSDTNWITSQQGIFTTFLFSTNCVCDKNEINVQLAPIPESIVELSEHLLYVT